MIEMVRWPIASLDRRNALLCANHLRKLNTQFAGQKACSAVSR